MPVEMLYLQTAMINFILQVSVSNKILVGTFCQLCFHTELITLFPLTLNLYLTFYKYIIYYAYYAVLCFVRTIVCPHTVEVVLFI